MSIPFPTSFINTLGGSGWEIAVILLAILLLFGADALPGTLRTMGRWSEQLRRISQDLQREISDAEEPFHQARLEWREQTRDLTVSSDEPLEEDQDPLRAEAEPDPAADTPPNDSRQNDPV